MFKCEFYDQNPNKTTIVATKLTEERNEFGPGFKFKDKKIMLTQEAYVTDTQDFVPRTVYVASAVDEEGEIYEVIWECISESENEDEICDWDKPSKIIKL